MATPDQVPAEANVDRPGPQLTASEARAMADDGATAQTATPSGGSDQARDRPVANERGRGGVGHTAGETAELDMTHPEAALGGADAVQKTSYGVGHGTEPDGRMEFAPVGRLKGEGPVVAGTATGGGQSVIAWLVGGVAVVLAVLYGVGIFAN